MASQDSFDPEDDFQLVPLESESLDEFQAFCELPEFDADPVQMPPLAEEPMLPAAMEAPFVSAAEPLTDDEIAKKRSWRKFMLGAVPSWMISLVLHVILILALAMVTLDPVSKVLSILESSGQSESQEIDEFELQGPQPLQSAQSAEESVTMPESSIAPQVDMSQIQKPSLSSLQANMAALEMDSLTENLLNRNLLSSTGTPLNSILTSRNASSKSEMIEKYGGSADSEKSVALSLKWLAAHQLKNGPRPGAWSFNHSLAVRAPSTGQGEFAESTNAATALALLPFLGAGQTHIDGQYKQTVKSGLASLIMNMKVDNAGPLPTGSWHERRGNMYSHGLATIAICEAYAMTRDPDLLQPAQLAMNYIITGQDPRGGGWRYEPREPGDTSVVGWCLMGLKSGRMGNLSVPPSTFTRANDFLNFVSTDNGAFYGYTEPRADRNVTLTSVGLLCRMYLGWPKEHPGLEEGIKHLNATGPRLDNLYYTYYATQIMRHYGGDVWEQWNSRLRDPLVKDQVTEGTDAGSWDPKGAHSKEGGRLYQTALATMILEVYYRHLPLYSDKSLEDDFEI